MMWSVSAEREHRYKMPEVRIERVETILGLKCSFEDLADMFCNSPADSHLRDTGQSRSLSTRRHRRRRPVARAPHRKTRGQKTLDVEIRRSWDTACRAAVVKTFVYMRRSESTSSTNAVPSVGDQCLVHSVCKSEVDLLYRSVGEQLGEVCDQCGMWRLCTIY
jgi:hypothetical protein